MVYPIEYPIQGTSLFIYEKSNTSDSLVLQKELSVPQVSYTFKPSISYKIAVFSPFLSSATPTYFKADTLRCPLNIYLKPIEKTFDLKEITVKAERQRFEKQGDTLVIHVKDSDARPHAEAHTLFDRIQGLESSGNGSLRVLGKNVQEVTVDGKKIFGGVGSLTLDNIKANMIERMEFIESSPSSPQQQNTLNIVLKANRKKGIYGNISAGYGNNQSYAANARFSKIMPKGFLSAFTTANSINDRGIDPKTLEEMTVQNYKKTMNRQGSAIGLYETDLAQETQNQLPIHQRLQGINQYADMGFNVTHIGPKLEIDGFVIGIANQNNQEQRQTSYTVFNTATQNLESLKNKFEQLRHAHAQINLTWKINPKTTFQLSNQLQLGESQLAQTDSIQSLIERFNTNSLTTRQISQNTSLLDNILQMSGVRKGKKPGVVSSLYYQMHYTLPSEDKIFSNFLTSFSGNQAQNQALEKNNQIKYSNAQFIHARPLTRRLLLEGKLKYAYQHVQLWQRTEPLDNTLTPKNSSFINMNQEQTTKIESGLYIFYKRPKTQIISGLGYWHWLIHRQADELKFEDAPNFWLNPFTKVNFRISNSSLSYKFAREPYLPTWQAALGIVDSSEVFNLVRGNHRLQHYRQNSSDLTFTSSTKNGYQVNFSLSYRQIEQEIINRNEFNPQNGSFESTFSNAQEPTSVYNAHVTLFRLRPQSRFTWFFLGGILGVNSLMETQNELTPLQTRLGFTQINSTLKLREGFQIRADMRSHYSFLAGRWQSNHQLTLRNSLDIGKKWYFDSYLRFNANVTDRFQIQSFVNTELSRYFLKNQKLKASWVIRNATNTKQEVSISQSNNTIATNAILHLPFTTLLKFTLYPERWK